MNVFIVEDAFFLQEMLCHILKKQGVQVAGVAGSGDLSLKKIKALKPDLVLLDLVLPNQNGLHLLKEIKKLHLKVKVIICSSLSYEQAKLTEETFSADGYIQKPFDIDELMSQVLSFRPKEHEVA